MKSPIQFSTRVRVWFSKYDRVGFGPGSPRSSQNKLFQVKPPTAFTYCTFNDFEIISRLYTIKNISKSLRNLFSSTETSFNASLTCKDDFQRNVASKSINPVNEARHFKHEWYLTDCNTNLEHCNTNFVKSIVIYLAAVNHFRLNFRRSSTSFVKSTIKTNLSLTDLTIKIIKHGIFIE